MYRQGIVDTINQIQNNQYMSMLDRKEMVTRDKWKDFGVDIYAFMDDLKQRGITIVLVLGYEGTGKSYGIKYLNPEETVWWHADNKPITFKGGKQAYYNSDGTPKNNLKVPKTYEEIITWLDAGIAAYKKDNTKGINPNDFIMFLNAHIEDYKSEETLRQRLKVLGNMATKMNIEGSVVHCYYTVAIPEGEKTKFKLRTQNTGFNTGRSPEEMYEDTLIDNNFQLIVEAIRNY